jgi:hypothetical protein
MLAPWHPLVERIWWYTLAWAQHRTGLAVHQSTLVMNHHHTEVTGGGLGALPVVHILGVRAIDVIRSGPA